MIDHRTVRPVNLTDEELEAFLAGLEQLSLYDYEEDDD